MGPSKHTYKNVLININVSTHVRISSKLQATFSVQMISAINLPAPSLMTEETEIKSL